MSYFSEDFFLTTETARRLYHEVAEGLPIIDYHCHISPREIAEDKRFSGITEAWLGGDHYKWRLIRSNGVPEEEITGGADDFTKFLRFAEALPKAIGNPLYQWCHLELKRYFGFEGTLCGDNAREVYDFCNKKLQEPGMTARGLIERSGVKMIGTTDDPADDLKWHRIIREDPTFKTLVLPTFRPDKAVNIEKPGFREYLGRLSDAAGKPIGTLADLKLVLKERLDYFCELGCRATDHGLDYFPFVPASEKEAADIFENVLKGKEPTAEEAEKFKTNLLLFLGREIASRGLVMQIHYNVRRNVNTAVFLKKGPDMGFDCMASGDSSAAITCFLDALDGEGKLPKTVLYSLNPKDNAVLDSLIGAFQGPEIPGKIQHGAAWWFNDTKRGMEDQLRSLAQSSILGNFIGMLTDSRSFLSYTRHEYFRRILCGEIGRWVEDEEFPNDRKFLDGIVRGICCENAAGYFGIN